MDLYIHQGKSLEEVMEWFKVNQDFAPRYVADKGASTARGRVLYGDHCAAVLDAYQSLPFASETDLPTPFPFEGWTLTFAFTFPIVRERSKVKSRDGTSLQSMSHLTQTRMWLHESESYGLEIYRRKRCWQCYGRNVLQA